MPYQGVPRIGRSRLLLTALGIILVYFCVYGARIELSGDQTAPVVAAESMLHEGAYKVSLHESYGPSVVVNIGSDLRQPLRWYPPGYSVALYALAKLGLSLAGSALVIFYLAKLLWTISWMAACLANRVPYPIAAGAVGFALMLTYPSTTTEIFESIAIALLFFAVSKRLGRTASAGVASASLAAGTFFRFPAAKLLGFYALVEWARRPRLATCFRVLLAAMPALIVYFVCTRLIGGESTPYHGVGPGQRTNWLLLLKGFYYAVTGGWSPSNLPLRILAAAMVLMAATGLVRRAWKGALPRWIVLLAGFQAYYMVFLIVTQVLFGSMYAYTQPAFATARFYSLTQPFSVAALYVLASFSLPTLSFGLRRALAAILLLCMVDWTIKNHSIMAGMTQGPDGFLRFADLAAVHRKLGSEHLDGIFDATGVFVYTAADPRIIYPDNVRGLRSPSDTHIAVVRFAGPPNDLVDALEKRIAPYEVQRFDRFEVDCFALPRGFEIQLTPRAGFVPHV
jgi:hypothetical protein